MMSLDIAPKTMQELRKICRGLMWKAGADVSGGHCLVAWARGDLEIPQAQALFESATMVVVGNGERALFWKDRWLHGARVADHVPNLVAMVPTRKAKVSSVKDGLAGEWLRDCGPDLSPAAVAEFFHLWGILASVTLVQEQDDSFVWR
jgi:hypothetical protein